MELDIETKLQLTDLLAKPSMVSDAHIDLLTDLVKVYPYYQPLHLLLAKASEHTVNHQRLLATASLYNGGGLVHQLLFNPKTLDQETYIKTEPVLSVPEIAVNDEQETFEEIVELTQESTTVPNELAIESIVSSDFFAFEQNFNSEQVSNDTLIVTQPEEYNQEAEAQSTVSKYDDDKLPYTFLWWLAKTRKEHEQIFQPYVTQKQQPTNSTNQQSELQHQYVEHIFHLQTPFNVADEAKKGPLNLQNKPKGIDIIDSFIKNDPQIKAPKAEQINTENKAKKSAEDNYDLVSETLASIYIEQMLYHKAIDTYEKLSLKFPEKSRYFADLIQSLEKKI
ncbi:MAG: hypothetical protein V4663_07570 [Bacteroidota bacterium]